MTAFYIAGVLCIVVLFSGIGALLMALAADCLGLSDVLRELLIEVIRRWKERS